jgi:hypothetical protein
VALGISAAVRALPVVVGREGAAVDSRGEDVGMRIEDFPEGGVVRFGRANAMSLGLAGK